jgi:hypothetical protein
MQAMPPGGASETEDKAGIHAGFVSSFSGFNGASSGGIIYTVPAGKRLVIENASAMCATSPTEKVYRSYLYFTNGGSGLSHHMMPTYKGPDANPNFHINLINWSGRLYADAGAVQFGAFKSGTQAGSYTCHYAISGYLVTVP